jgi:hypothetical protein
MGHAGVPANAFFFNLVVAFGARKDLYFAQFGHAVNPNA